MSKRGSSKITKKEVSKMIDRKIDAKIETKKRIVRGLFAVGTIGVITPLSGLVAQGNGNGTRLGIVIDPVNLKMNIEWIIDDPTNVIRTTVIQWFNDDEQNAPTLAKIFEDTANERPLSPFRFQNVNSVFRVLFDNISSLTDVSPAAKIIKINLFGRRLPKTINYNGATTTGSHQLYLVTWTDSAASGPQFKFQGFLSYKDA